MLNKRNKNNKFKQWLKSSPRKKKLQWIRKKTSSTETKIVTIMITKKMVQKTTKRIRSSQNQVRNQRIVTGITTKRTKKGNNKNNRNQTPNLLQERKFHELQQNLNIQMV